MKGLIERLQKDVIKLQDTFHKESTDFLDKIKKVELKESLDAKRKELEKVIGSKMKSLEPAYDAFLNELRKNAKKAGIDVDRIEKEIVKRTTVAKRKFGLDVTPQKKKKRVVKKKTSAKKVVRKAAKKVAKKATGTGAKRPSAKKVSKKKD